MLNRSDAVRPLVSLASPLERRGVTLAIRIAVVLVALGILYLRMPGSFTHPQLWAEDNDFLYKTLNEGWSSFFTVIAGWLAAIQFLVAILASYFGPAAAPAVFNYAAFALSLLVVWLVTSPRLDLPYKPLLAIAVVIVPMGYEELGTLTNSQWILPIGVFAMAFMSRSMSPIILLGEAALVLITALSGAFAIFLTPLFLWQLIAHRRTSERSRLLLLTGILCIGAIVQVTVLAFNPSVLNLVAPTPYSWTVWVNLPFTQFMTTFGPSISALFHGLGGAVLGLVLLGSAIFLAVQTPYRTQKLSMLFLALAIAVSGMFKFRAALETQFASQRYFYVGSVFALWFICCLSNSILLRRVLASVVVLAELALLPMIANTPRFAEDQQWPVWASYLSSGLPVIIPTTPAGFYLSLPPTAIGPLARFGPWMGHPIGEVAERLDAAACTGSVDPVESAGMIYLQPVRREQDLWVAKGSVWDSAGKRPVQLVALTDSADRVIGFGFPGFKPNSTQGAQKTAWNSIFYAAPGTTMHAYGIVDNGKSACAFGKPRSFPLNVQPLASNQFSDAVAILPGKPVIQRFKPLQQLEEISLAFVTWGVPPSRYAVDWKINTYSRGNAVEAGSGTIEPTTMRDWQRIKLPLLMIPADIPDQVEVTFSSSASVNPAAPLGLPLYKPATTIVAPAAEVGGIPVPSGAQIGLSSAYVR